MTFTSTTGLPVAVILAANGTVASTLFSVITVNRNRAATTSTGMPV